MSLCSLPNSTITINAKDGSIFTIECGVSIETTFDARKCYVVGMLQDRSKSMLAVFSPDIKEPFPLIQEWLEDNFNPGPSAAARTNGAYLYFIIKHPKEGDSKPITMAFIAMANNTTTFRVQSHAHTDAADPNCCVDNATLYLNSTLPGLAALEYPLLIGNRGHTLDWSGVPR